MSTGVLSPGWKTVDVTNAHPFRVPVEFEFVKKLGAGAFATAAAFKNQSTQEQVAVKKIENAFQDVVDGKRHLREVQLLQQLKHDNIISILDMFLPASRNFDDVYIVQDLMDTDLHKVITSRQVLEEEHHRYFVYQILLGISYIHSANLVHRDLKPANVLVNKNCDVKVCDFGLARAGCFDPNLTDYVVTRWWRAPEVVLLPSAYTEKVDIWAIGCILAELMGRTPLFKGKDHLDQVKKIFSVTGKPAEADLTWLPAKPHPAWGFVARLDACPKKPWGMIYPNASQSAMDTLEAMLCVNPWHRASAKQAMFLEYFQPLYMEGDVKDAEAQIYCEIDRMETVTLTKHFLQNSMYAEICKMHPEMMQARVIQLHPSLVAADGTLAVHCHGIGGDEIATIVTEPGQDIGALRAKLSTHLDEPMDFLQLLKANGCLLNRCDAEEHLAVVIALDARIASAA